MKLVIDERVKHRLIGIAVILSVAAIFAPAMMKKNQILQERHVNMDVKMPARPRLPEVDIATKDNLFKQVEVAHVDLSRELPEPIQNKELKINDVALESVDSKPLTITEPVRETVVEEKSMVNLAELAKEESIKNPVKRQDDVIEIKKPVTAHVQEPAKNTSKVEKPVKAVKPVKTLSKQKALTGSQIYSVQLASFSSKQNAKKLEQRLVRQGYKDVQIQYVSNKNGDVFKVSVGHLKSRNEAEHLKSRLAEKTSLKGFITHQQVA